MASSGDSWSYVCCCCGAVFYENIGEHDYDVRDMIRQTLNMYNVIDSIVHRRLKPLTRLDATGCMSM